MYMGLIGCYRTLRVLRKYENRVESYTPIDSRKTQLGMFPWMLGTHIFTQLYFDFFYNESPALANENF